MEGFPLWVAVGALGLAGLILLRKPLRLVGRVLFRTSVGVCCLWLFNQLGGLIGIRLGVNLVSGLILGLLGAPGLGLLLMAKWILR